MIRNKRTDLDNLDRLLTGRNTAYTAWDSLIHRIDQGEKVDNAIIVYCIDQCNRWDYEISNFKYKNYYVDISNKVFSV